MKNKGKQVKKNKEVIEIKNQLARALADYDNLRKRTDIEREVLIKFSTERVLARLLPVLDILEKAQAHLKDQGLVLAIADFKRVLSEEMLEEIRPKPSETFNHDIHEAVESLNGGRKGTIAEIVMPGWRFIDGPVIRYAKVKVYGEKVDKKEKEELEKEVSR